jgi:6-phosphofructokinase 1
MQSTQAALRLCGKCRTLKNARAFFKLSDYNRRKLKMAKRKIGILTSGGDCPSLNATIRGAVKSFYQQYGEDKVEIIGISNGFHGLIHNECTSMSPSDFFGLLTKGGTILSSKRTPFKMMEVIEDDGIDKISKMKKTYKKHGLDCVLTFGGNGTHKNANLLREEGMNVIALPKTIDNDINGTDVTFGFHTAVEVGTEVIDRLHTTAHSHSRVMVVEIMGNKSGFLSLYTGVASGADVIILPEIPYSDDKVLEAVTKRKEAGKPYSIVVVAEGAMDENEAKMKGKERSAQRAALGEKTVTNRLVKLIQNRAGIESRAVVPGHMLRGGVPSAYDRILATQFGARAAVLFEHERFGYTIAKKGNEISENLLIDIVGKPKRVNVDDVLIHTA